MQCRLRQALCRCGSSLAGQPCAQSHALQSLRLLAEQYLPSIMLVSLLLCHHKGTSCMSAVPLQDKLCKRCDTSDTTHCGVRNCLNHNITAVVTSQYRQTMTKRMAQRPVWSASYPTPPTSTPSRRSQEQGAAQIPKQWPKHLRLLAPC